ncbi:MAG: ATP-binding protein [Bacteroidales bacterium]|nr:ATP-binding protein [Bacteroidales bacterium]
MTKHLSIFVLLVVLLHGCTQEPSDRIGFQSNTESRLKIDSLEILDSMVNLYKASNNILAHKYANKALSLALSINTEEALAQAFMIKGIAYKNFNNDSSFIFYSKAVKIVEANNIESLRAKLYYNIAMVYLAAADHKMAIIMLDSTISIARITKDFALLSNAYNSVGSIKNNLLDTASSRIMFDSAFRVARRYNLSKQTGVALASLSLFEKNPLIVESKRKSAILILSREPGNEEEIAMIQLNIGLTKSDPDSAIAYYQASLEMTKSGNFPELEVTAYNNMAYSFLDKKDFMEAESCLKVHAIPIAQKLENFNWLSSLYDTYADVMLAQDNKSKAFDYERQSLKMRHGANRKYASEQVRLLSALLDLKNKEIRIQSNESDLQKKENKIRVILFLFGCTVLLLLLTVLFYSWRLQKNRIRYQESLLKSAKKLIDLEETQKGRLSMELHDLANPFYISMLKHIEMANISDRTIENELKEKLSTLTSSIREISHRIDNSFIGQIPLPELIAGLTKDIQAVSAVPITYKVSDNYIDLPIEKTLHIYRIIQEILFNAMKYVTEGKVEIELAIEENHLFVFYSDTGPGIEEVIPKTKGLGISNIYERARLLGGKANMSSIPGSGTTWNISIPLSK